MLGSRQVVQKVIQEKLHIPLQHHKTKLILLVCQRDSNESQQPTGTAIWV